MQNCWLCGLVNKAFNQQRVHWIQRFEGCPAVDEKFSTLFIYEYEARRLDLLRVL